jgi:hypothetical protein
VVASLLAAGVSARLPTTLPVVGLGQEVQSRARKPLDHKETLRPSLCSDWPERFVAEWSNRSLNHSGATHAREGFASPSRDCIASDRGVVSTVVVSLSLPGRPCFLVGVAFLGAMAVLTRTPWLVDLYLFP